MSYELIIFTSPESTIGILNLDNGTQSVSHPAVHSSGRKGIGFTIPTNSPQVNGCSLVLAADKKVPLTQRARLIIRDGGELSNGFPWDSSSQTAALLTDDFILEDEKICPPCPEPTPIPPPEPDNTPLELINDVYLNNNFDLSTKAGCGEFTEECCIELHEVHSIKWGHIKKFPPQNMYNGHAVDALMLLSDVGDIKAGIYDIIKSSESVDAEPAFNFKGPPEPSLWYYPAQ